jgi:dihydrofolate reductase
MRTVIYGYGVSLDGYVADPQGVFDFTRPDAELHRFHNDLAKQCDVELYGRRMWETMQAWETLGDEPGAPPEIVEFAEVWKARPKLVFSRTLEDVEGTNVALATADPASEIARLKGEGDGDIGIGGAGLAASVIDLVDEFRLWVNPVLVGGGTPFFPELTHRIPLELAETRTFGGQVVYLRYRRR